jgi:DNA polymerase-3 subunit epsilon
MKIAGLDLETTGFDASTGDRIVEVALVTCTMDEHGRLTPVDEYVRRVNPERPIPAEATNVHGITYEQVAACPKWIAVAPEVQRRLRGLDKIIIHNEDFDAPFLAHELLRMELELPEVQTYCTMKNARWATYDGKFPNLGELAFALGVEFDPSKAHGAEYDVLKMLECYAEGRRRGFYE